MAYSSNNIIDWYTEGLGRAPDSEGLNFWTKMLASGMPAQEVYNNFMQSAAANNEKVNQSAIQPIAKTFDKYENIAPKSYVENDVPALASNTEAAIWAGINKAMENSRSAGRDPENNYWVNTLRGYFSGDPNLKARAIHSLSTVDGLRETNDYGYTGLRGNVTGNTTPVNFKTAYDPNWEINDPYNPLSPNSVNKNNVAPQQQSQGLQGLLAQPGVVSQNQGLLGQSQLQQNWVPAQQNQQQNLMQGIVPFQFSSLNNPFQMPTTMMTQPQQMFNAPTQQQMGLLSNADRFQGQQRNRYGLL